MPRNERTLITGGGGSLGRILLETLASDDPVAFDLKPPRGDFEFIAGSVTSAAELTRAAEKARCVVHAAALLARGHAPEKVFEINALGTWNALQAAEAAGCESFVLISSECATGLCFQRNERPPAYLPVDEAHMLQPTDAYSVSKMVGEQIVEAFRRRSRMRIVVLRPLYIMFDEQAHTIPARQDLWHHDLWGYVDPLDVALAVQAAVKRRDVEGTFFLGAPDTLCERPTLELVRERFGIVAVADEQLYLQNPRAAIFDSQKARNVLGIDFRSSWRDLLQKASRPSV